MRKHRLFGLILINNSGNVKEKAGMHPFYRRPDVYKRQYIRSSFIHTYHDQCELQMGSEKDGGVVDGFGEVHGVKKLTVADASIIPYHMDGNTSASAYLIGHVIAKHLLGEE